MTEQEAKQKAIKKLSKAAGQINAAQALLLKAEVGDQFVTQAQDFVLKAIDKLKGGN